MITTQCLLCGTKGIISSKKLADFLARSKHKSNGYWLVDCDCVKQCVKNDIVVSKETKMSFSKSISFLNILGIQSVRHKSDDEIKDGWMHGFGTALLPTDTAAG